MVDAPPPTLPADAVNVWPTFLFPEIEADPIVGADGAIGPDADEVALFGPPAALLTAIVTLMYLSTSFAVRVYVDEVAPAILE